MNNVKSQIEYLARIYSIIINQYLPEIGGINDQQPLWLSILNSGNIYSSKIFV